MRSGLDRLEFDVACSQIAQDCILNHLKEEEHEAADKENEPHEERSDATVNGLKRLVEAVKADRLIQKTRDAINELLPLPSLLDATSASGLKEIGTYINDLTGLWEDAGRMVEIMDQIKDLRKAKDSLTARRNKELKAAATPTSISTSSTTGPTLSSSFRLPRIELPTFDGKQENWRNFWDEFQNALKKDPLLTDTDKLYFLRTAITCEEGKDIVSTGSRGGKDYSEIVKSLLNRYDRPCEMCRILLQRWIQHTLDSSHSCLGKAMSLMQRTLTTLEEHTDFSVPTVMSIIMELKMSGTIFQDWMKDTSSMKQPPSAKHMLDFVECYRRGLAATGTPVQPANKSHIPVKPYKSFT